MEQGNNCKLAEAPKQRVRTVGEVLDETIAGHVNELHRLTELKIEAQRKNLLDLPQPLIASLAWPDNAFQ